MNETKQQTVGAFVLPAPQYDKDECLKVVNELRKKYFDGIDNQLAGSMIWTMSFLCRTCRLILLLRRDGGSFS